MSEESKVRRQNHKVPKVRFDLMLWEANYDFLCMLSRAERISMAAKFNDILLRMRRGVPQGTFPTEE